MKLSLTWLVLVLLLVSVLSGCAAGANQFQGTSSEQHGVAGFWLGLWQGFIAPIVFVASLFKSNINIYEVHNNGAWYNFGYLFGLACLFGGSGNRTARRATAG
jgi:Na+/H+-dicarboxylate symporter